MFSPLPNTLPHDTLDLLMLTSIPPHSLHMSLTSLPFLSSYFFHLFPTVLPPSLLWPSFSSHLQTASPTITFSFPSHLICRLAPSSSFHPVNPVWLPAPFGGDGSDRGQGAGRTDQGSPASWRCAVHSAGHGPAGGAAGRPAQEPHTGRQGQRCPQPHQGNAEPGHGLVYVAE